MARRNGREEKVRSATLGVDQTTARFSRSASQPGAGASLMAWLSAGAAWHILCCFGVREHHEQHSTTAVSRRPCGVGAGYRRVCYISYRVRAVRSIYMYKHMHRMKTLYYTRLQVFGCRDQTHTKPAFIADAGCGVMPSISIFGTTVVER